MRALLLAVIAMLLVGRARAEDDRSGVRPEVISLPKGPGSIEGLGASFDPNSNTGSATYDVPLAVPPGVGGLVPDLALRYASGAGYGELGVGWTLGLPAVERSAEHGLPTYGEEDVFTLRGMGGSEELVQLVDGSYRFRIEGAFVRGRQRADGSWEFRNRSGVAFRFGLGNATVRDGQRVFAWLLSEQEDTHGNRIVYAYDRDATGRPYLARVTYNDFGSAYRNEVVLHWEPRPDGLTSYLPGFAVTVAQRLATVEIKHGGEAIRTYSLTYDEVVGLSRLGRVNVVGRDGKTGLPPITFTYAPFAPEDATLVQMGDGPTRGLGREGELTDVNGDALPDLLVTDPSSDGGRYRWYLNRNGTSFDPARVMDDSPSVWLSNPSTQLADLDGNGEADVVAKISSTADGVRFYPATDGIYGEGVVVSSHVFDLGDPDVRPMDLDHDKLTDFLRIDPSSGELAVVLNRGAGEFAPVRGLGRLDPQEILTFTRGLRIADMNGDGLSDLVMARSGSVRVWPGLGGGRFGTYESLRDAPHWTDADASQGLQVRDLNGDGLADLVIVGLHEVRYWLNLAGVGLAEEQSLATPEHSSNAVLRVADMNGNGTADLVWIDPEGSVTWQYQDVLPYGTPGLLTRIDNGLGKVVTIEYAGMGEVHRAAPAHLERVARNPIAQTVVYAVTVSDSLGNDLRTEYRYAGGYYDASAREFRGFALSQVREFGDNDQPTLITQRTFDVGSEDEALKGMLRMSERRNEGGRVFDRVENQFALRELENGQNDTPVRYGFVRQTDTFVYEGGATSRVVRSEWDHDEHGNVVLEAAYGEVCGEDTTCGDDETITRRTFAVNPGLWVVDRVATERVENARGERVAESRTYYDGESFEGLALGEVARGSVTRTEAWFEGERYVSTGRYARDSYGNTIVMRNARGGRREVDYDPETHTFAVEERQVPEEGRAIAWHVRAIDRAFGAVLEVEGPNGDVTRFRHDALGRPSAIVEEGDSDELPTRVFAYELGSPLSLVRDEQREESGQSGTLVRLSRVDGLGRTRNEMHEGSQEGEWIYEGLVAFGARGWEKVRGLATFGGESEPPKDWMSRATTFAYDAIGRLVREHALDGAQTRTEYGVLSRRVWDANDNDPSSPHYDTPTQFFDDGHGRLRTTIERDGAREVTTARYDYDALGSLVRMEDALGRVRTYRYDGRSLLVRIDDPNAGIWTQHFTDAGELECRVDPTGRTVRYTHDLLGRVREEWHTLAGEQEERVVRYHYDEQAADHPELGHVRGRLAWIEDSAGAVFHGYTSRGLLGTRIRRWEDGTEHATWTDFDSADRPVRRGYPDASFLTYRYDARGLLLAAGPVASELTYNAAGALTSMLLGNGVTERRHYDARDRLTRMEARKGKTPLRDLELSLDRASRITATTDHAAAKGDVLSLGARYTFDDRYRLRSVVDNLGTTTWSYDDVANVQSVSSDHADGFLNTTNTYGEDGAGPDQVTHHGDRALRYDAAGRVVDDGERALTWDAKGRLTRVERGKLIEEYVYGHDDGRAVKRTRRGTKLESVRYIDADAEERDGKLTRYVFVGKERVAKLDGAGQGTPAQKTAATCASSPASASGFGALWLLAVLGLIARRGRHGGAALAVVLAGLFVSCAPTADVRGQAHPITGLPSGATFYLTDHVDTPVLVLDAQGGVAEQRSHHAYGVERAPASDAEPWSFVGNELDATELANFHARPYDARLGRFLAVDPEPLLNPNARLDARAFAGYAYAAGDPINLADPSGKSIWTKIVKVGIKVYKTGSAAQAFADNVQDALTVFDSNASTFDRVVAGVSLASELLPISVGDVKDVGRVFGVVADVSHKVEKRLDAAPIQQIAEKYNRRRHYGGAQTDSPAAKAIRDSAEGAPCPSCTSPMISGTRTQAVPEHDPTLVEHFYEGGGHAMTDAQRRAYARSPEALNGALCLTCQKKQGREAAQYSKEQAKKNGL